MLQLLRNEAEKGNVCFFDMPDHIVKVNLNDFVKQPADGILYDLNRDQATSSAFISRGDTKWVNNFAVALVITKLKQLIDKHNQINDNKLRK